MSRRAKSTWNKVLELAEEVKVKRENIGDAAALMTYLMTRKRDAEGYVITSVNERVEELGLTYSKQRKLFDKLCEAGYLKIDQEQTGIKRRRIKLL